MQNQKNILMPVAFVFDVSVLTLRLGSYALDRETARLCKAIDYQINAKLDAMKARESFSKCKSAPPGSNEREAMRRQYLELAHVHKDWISDVESDH